MTWAKVLAVFGTVLFVAVVVVSISQYWFKDELFSTAYEELDDLRYEIRELKHKVCELDGGHKWVYKEWDWGWTFDERTAKRYIFECYCCGKTKVCQWKDCTAEERDGLRKLRLGEGADPTGLDLQPVKVNEPNFIENVLCLYRRQIQQYKDKLIQEKARIETAE